MRISTIKSKYVFDNNRTFFIYIGISHYGLGFKIHNWGIRLMLITHHICFHF